MKDHTYRPCRLPSTCPAERETTGRRFCCGFECGCFEARLDAAIEAFAEVL